METIQVQIKQLLANENIPAIPFAFIDNSYMDPEVAEVSDQSELDKNNQQVQLIRDFI